MKLRSLFFLSSLASVAYSQDLNDADFVRNPQATAINGDSIKVEFYSTVEARDDYQELNILRPLVMRMHGSAIEFDPRVVVTPGVDIQCRQPGDNNGAIDPLPSHCEEHCVASGQYCDMQEVEGIPSYAFPIEKLDGYHHIHELVSRRCVWLNYGDSHPTVYFHYFDSMAGGTHPCFHHLSRNCMERSYMAAGVDLEIMQTCLAGMSVQSTDQVPILEQSLQQTMPSDLPALFVNGREVAEHHMTVLQNLEYVCAAFDEQDTPNKPLICEFCLAHCPEKAETPNVGTCLWELKCEDDSTFNQFLEEKGIAVEEPPEETEPPAATTETATEPPATTEAPVTTTEAPKDAAATTTTSTSTSSTTTETSSSSKEKEAEKGLGIFLTILVALCGLFAFMVAIYAVRIQRSRAVIDKYLKAKAELEVMTSPGGHHDHEYFPTEGAMEGSDSMLMDLDGDFPQYSDQLTGMSQRGCTAAPKASSFLPEIQ